MTPASLAVIIYDEIGHPSNINVANIEYWIVNNVILLNTLVDAEYSNVTGSTDIDAEHANLLKAIYEIRYFQGLLNSNYGAAGASGGNLLEVSSDGGTVKFANRTELIKTINQTISSLKSDLKNLIAAYKYRDQVIGNISGTDGDFVRLPTLKYEPEER